jgi:flagellar FliL protein
MAEVEFESGEEKKSSKKLIIIIMAVLILISGGGAGYYFFFMGDSAGDSKEQVEEPEEEEETGNSELFYFDLEKPFIVQFPKGNEAKLLQVSISIQVNDELFIEELKKHEPMIRNNFLMVMADTNAGELKTVEGKENLKTSLLEALNEIMAKMSKKNHVEDLFFTALVMQ